MWSEQLQTFESLAGNDSRINLVSLLNLNDLILQLIISNEEQLTVVMILKHLCTLQFHLQFKVKQSIQQRTMASEHDGEILQQQKILIETNGEYLTLTVLWLNQVIRQVDHLRHEFLAQTAEPLDFLVILENQLDHILIQK